MLTRLLWNSFWHMLYSCRLVLRYYSYISNLLRDYREMRSRICFRYKMWILISGMCNIPNFGRCYFRFVLATKNLWFSLVVKDNILNVYCETLSQGTLFVVLQSIGHEVEQIGATAEILERLLERRMQCHLHTSPNPIANKLTPAEVDLLDILLHVHCTLPCHSWYCWFSFLY